MPRLQASRSVTRTCSSRAIASRAASARAWSVIARPLGCVRATQACAHRTQPRGRAMTDQARADAARDAIAREEQVRVTERDAWSRGIAYIRADPDVSPSW